MYKATSRKIFDNYKVYGFFKFLNYLKNTQKKADLENMEIKTLEL
jgi:hypothetical protein